MRPLTLITYKIRITAGTRVKPETDRERGEGRELEQCGNLKKRCGKRHCKIM